MNRLLDWAQTDNGAMVIMGVVMLIFLVIAVIGLEKKLFGRGK